MHPLHMRHRSITSHIRCDVRAPAGNCPVSARRKAFARPRVECSSSRVTMNEGHMVPEAVLRHTPEPLHISAAARNP